MHSTLEGDRGRASGLTGALWRVGATALQLVGSRVELATVELEEELHRAAKSLLWGIALVAATTLTLAFLGLTIVLLWRGTHPVLAAFVVAIGFGILAVVIGRRWNQSGKARTSLLEATRSELRADLDALRGASANHPTS